MILVEYISVITEGSRFVLCFQTNDGMFCQYISDVFAGQLRLILENQNTLYGALLEETKLSLNHCLLFEKDSVLSAELITEEKMFVGMWKEGVLIALELKVPIFLADGLIKNEFDSNDQAHDEFVAELIEQEKRYDKSHKIKQTVQEMMQAVADEKYELAAHLRDKLTQLKNKN